MKMIVSVLSMLVFVVACNASSTKTSEEKTEQVKASAVTGKEEDCDDKAKKPIEIKEETISLTGNAGCTLDEAKP